MTLGSVDVVVVGGGPAGLGCATALAAEGASVTLFERQSLGGQLVNARLVEGIRDQPSSGPELSGDLAEEAYDYGVQVEFADVTDLQRDLVRGGWSVSGPSGAARSQLLVVATGSRPVPLDVPGAGRLAGRGVSYCATCDGPLFRGKNVTVLMRDEWSADEAVQLADSAASVVALLHPEYSAELADHLGRLEGLPAIDLRTDTAAIEVIGDDVVSGIRVTGHGEESSWDTDAVFCSLGALPETELLTGVDLDAAGAVVADASGATSVAGMFVVGELRAGTPHTARSALDDGKALAPHLLARLS